MTDYRSAVGQEVASPHLRGWFDSAKQEMHRWDQLAEGS